MHSLKNTFVAVVLLGVSYFVYNGLTNPAGQAEVDDSGLALDLEMPSEGLGDALDNVAEQAQSKVNQGIQDFSTAMEDLKLPPLRNNTTQPSGSNLANQIPSQSDFSPSRDSGFPQDDFRKQPSPEFRADLKQNTQPLNDFQPQSRPEPNQIANSNQFPDQGFRQPETETRVGDIAPRTSIANPTTQRDLNQGQVRVAGFTDDTDRGFATSTAATLDSAWPTVNQLVNQQRYREALGTLSQFYPANNLSAMETAKLHEWLDALAGKVIYSSEHNLVSNAYVIQANDTMQSIADQWQVPAQLVYNVNKAKIDNPLTLMPGNELKIIRGPFQARIDARNQKLTLFVNDLYAGRFNVKILEQLAPGQYQVTSKIANGGPMGDFELELTNSSTGSKCSLHAAGGGAGSIGLSPGEAQDVFGILSQGSRVTIQ